MARKPVHLQMVGGKSPRQHIWEAIRERRTGITAGDLEKRFAKKDVFIELGTIAEYARSLEKAGYIENVTPAGSPIGTPSMWNLVRDNGIEAPRVKKDGSQVTIGLGTEAMWRSMRFLTDFNSTELAGHASAGSEPVSVETAKTYIRFLFMAEYVEVVKPARALGKGKGAIQARYRLVPGKYTGPRPPMIQRTKSVYDPNLGKVVWSEELRHDY